MAGGCRILYWVYLAMKFRIGLLAISFLVFYLLWSHGMDLMVNGRDSFFARRFIGLKSLVLTFTTCIAFFVYSLSAYFFLWVFSERKRLWPAFGCILLLAPAIILFRYLLQEILLPVLLGFQNYHPDTRLSDYMLDNNSYAIVYSSFGIIFFFIQQLREKDMLLARNRQAELDFLKSQINPHFLFNSLNNIYSLVYKKSEKALPAVEKLSQLLRYMLYEKKEMVPIGLELSYLNSFIELQRMRYDFEVSLALDLRVPDEEREMAPLLLIPFVENAFKHGDLGNSAYPLRISLVTDEKCLRYEVSNRKRKMEKDGTGGIGLDNVKRRLDLLYGPRYRLQIRDEEFDFNVLLEIDF